MQQKRLIWALLLLCPNKSQNMIKKKPTMINMESGVSDQTWTDLSCEYSGRWCENSLPLSGFHTELN